MAGVRYPDRGRRFFQTTGGLQQRRQCRRALRPSVLLRRRFHAATRRCRQSSVPASAAALSTTVAPFAALVAWQVSWVIFEFLWKIYCRTINRSRSAIVVFTAIWKA